MLPPRFDADLLLTFVTIVNEGSFRAAAERVGKTQSAISMQMQRLEEAVGHKLLQRNRPIVYPTAKGETLLAYARRILRLQEEAWGQLSHQAVSGKVSFGAPDDYALRILPQILSHFATSYPMIEVDIHCETSTRLIELLETGKLNLALITRAPGRPKGDFLRRETLVWARSSRSQVHERDPIPLAVFQEDCLMRQFTTAALAEGGQRHRIAYSSPHLSALLAVTGAGLAIAALPRSSVPESLQIIGPDEGFPKLPDIELAILRGHSGEKSLVEALAGAAHAAMTSWAFSPA